MNGYLIAGAVILTVLSVVTASNWWEISKLRKRLHNNVSDTSAALMGVHMLAERAGDKEIIRALDGAVSKRVKKAVAESPYAHFKRTDEENGDGG